MTTTNKTTYKFKVGDRVRHVEYGNEVCGMISGLTTFIEVNEDLSNHPDYPWYKIQWDEGWEGQECEDVLGLVS